MDDQSEFGIWTPRLCNAVWCRRHRAFLHLDCTVPSFIGRPTKLFACCPSATIVELAFNRAIVRHRHRANWRILQSVWPQLLQFWWQTVLILPLRYEWPCYTNHPLHLASRPAILPLSILSITIHVNQQQPRISYFWHAQGFEMHGYR